MQIYRLILNRCYTKQNIQRIHGNNLSFTSDNLHLWKRSYLFFVRNVLKETSLSCKYTRLKLKTINWIIFFGLSTQVLHVQIWLFVPFGPICFQVKSIIPVKHKWNNQSWSFSFYGTTLWSLAVWFRCNCKKCLVTFCRKVFRWPLWKEIYIL